MINHRYYHIIGALTMGAMLGFWSPSVYGDPLPSWNDTPQKERIITFISDVTDATSPHFVKPEERIATFDNDGTLWCEKPVPTHLFAIFDRCNELISANPSLKEVEPYKAIISKDARYFSELYENFSLNVLLGQLLAVPFGGITTNDFARWNRQWLNTWKHPRFGVGVKQLVYQPMVELLHYLTKNGFQVYIFTADEGAFVRLVSEELYSIPPERVQGSVIRLEYMNDNGQPSLIRTYQAQYLNNWSGKPRLINQAIGKRPIFAGGNSNGDREMLQFADDQKHSIALLVHHTDGEREYRYDTHTEKVLPLAKKNGWIVVDMKNDWKTVFP